MASYKYMGKGVIYDNANDEYELELVKGDLFTIIKQGRGYLLNHGLAKEIPFILKASEAKELLSDSVEVLEVVPDPNNPPYLIYKPVFSVIEKLYDHYNKQLFNGLCPVIAFKKTSNSKVLGLAEMKRIKGKPVYTMYINEKTMADVKIFTNTIIHEMIHLYLYKKGIIEGNPDILTDGHGEHFQREMHRINGFGYNITIVADGETYQGQASHHSYAVVVDNGTDKGQVQIYFCLKNPIENFDDFCDRLRLEYPAHRLRVRLLETDDKRLHQFPKVAQSLKVSDKQIKLWYNAMPNPPVGRVIAEQRLDGGGSVIPDYKEIPEFYARSFEKFAAAMKRYGASHDYLFSKWKGTPVRLINKHVEETLLSVAGRFNRGSIADDDLYDILNDCAMAYQHRMEASKYIKTMRDMLARVDPNNKMSKHYRILRIF